MVKSVRLKEMEEYIIEKGVATMEELCDRFDISVNTLRNDIQELSQSGRIRKVYGGACSNVTNTGNALVSFDERKLKNVQSKHEIAKAAAELVEPGDIIFIDSGTTAVSMVEFLAEIPRLTIVTHSLDVVNKACALHNAEIFCLGGRFQESTNCFIGMAAEGALAHYNIGKAFMGTKGITQDGAITDSSMGEFEIKKWAVSKASEAFLLADSGKYGRAGLMSYSELKDFSALITDRSAGDELVKLCNRYETRIRLV